MLEIKESKKLNNGINVNSKEFDAVNWREKRKNYLDSDEIESLLKKVKKTRNGYRNYLLLLLMYRHGLRVSEVINLQISDINLNQAKIWIRRLKSGLSVEHPLMPDELRAIKFYLRNREDSLPFLFISERKQPLDRRSINIMLKRIDDKINPHMLRHSCGYYLANKGYDLRLIQDYLGHRDISSTVIYTRTSSRRFQNLWN